MIFFQHVNGGHNVFSAPWVMGVIIMASFILYILNIYIYIYINNDHLGAGCFGSWQSSLHFHMENMSHILLCYTKRTGEEFPPEITGATTLAALTVL